VGVAQSAGEEARSALRAQTDKWAADLDLIRREEFEAHKAEVADLRAQIAALKGAAS
jgi:BMFP domain-containing protein YqiC